MEPNSPWINDRESENHCPYFEYRKTKSGGSGEQSILDGTEVEKAKQAFKALFKTP